MLGLPTELCLKVIQLDAHLTCGAVRGHAGSQATSAAWKALRAPVNELSDERLSGFSNISTTLRCASSFNPSSPGWRDYFKMWTLRLRLCHQPAGILSTNAAPRPSLQRAPKRPPKAVFPQHSDAPFNDKCSRSSTATKRFICHFGFTFLQVK